MLFKLGYPEQTKKTLFAKYHLLNLDKIRAKMAVFNFIEKRQKSCFLPSGFFFRNHRSLQNQKSPFTVKFSPCSSLEVTSLFLFVSWKYSLLSYIVQPALASIFNTTTALHARKQAIFFFIFVQNVLPLLPTTEISRLLSFSVVADSKIYAVVGQEIHQQSNPKATSFRSGHYFSSYTSNKQNSQTKFITLLASLRKWTLSYGHA